MAIFGLLSALVCTACLQASQPVETKYALFVGNSYTYQHNIPERVAASYAALNGATVQLETAMIADGGQNLITYVDDPRVLRALDAQAWDFIILQDLSTAALFTQTRTEFNVATDWFKHIADAEGAELIFYQTWPRRDGHGLYDAPARAGFTAVPSAERMTQRIIQHYAGAAKKVRARIAPVGSCWMQTEDRDHLYAADGSHASPEGAVITARVIARTLAMREPLCG